MTLIIGIVTMNYCGRLAAATKASRMMLPFFTEGGRAQFLNAISALQSAFAGLIPTYS
jgi:hypothetical protein